MAIREEYTCLECHGTGLVRYDGCNCGMGEGAYIHEPFCGLDLCSCGIWFEMKASEQDAAIERARRVLPQ